MSRRAVANDLLSSTVTCPECGAIHPHGAHFCEECGTPLGGSGLAPASPESVALRRRASAQLRRGYRWTAAITWLYRLGVLGYAGMTIVAVGALSSPEVPLGPGLLVVGLSTTLTVAMLVGAIQILFRPFLWTVTIATLASSVAVAHLIGPNPLDLALLWSAGWAVLFWASVWPMRRFRQLIDEHTDLYIEHHASRVTKRGLEGRSPRERHERLLRAMNRAFRRARKLSVLAALSTCGVAVAASYLVVSNLRPQALSDAVERFEQAWNSDGAAGVGPLFDPDVRERESTWLRGVTTEYGWGDAWPELGGGTEREAEGWTWMDYQVAGVPVGVRWGLEDQRWHLRQVRLPVPPLEPAFDELQEAWARSDVSAIAALFPEGHQVEMSTSLAKAVQRRDWSPLPAVLEARVERLDDGAARTVLRVDDGEVVTAWRFRSNGRWRLHSIELPDPPRRR